MKCLRQSQITQRRKSPELGRLMRHTGEDSRLFICNASGSLLAVPWQRLQKSILSPVLQ